MHPKYVEQVLRDRGLPAPSYAQLEAFMAALTDAEVPEVHERIRKIALGVEQREDVDLLMDGINAAAPDPGQSTAPPAGSLAPAQPAACRAGRGRHVRGAARGTDLPPEVLTLLRQHGMHVYAKAGALKIELGTLREGEDTGALQYTLQVDAARSAGTRYDWQGKIPFQFMRRELPQLAAFLLGYGGKKLVLRNHGPDNDKHLDIEDQGGNLFVKVSQGSGRPVTVPVMPPDVFGWGELCLVALHLNRPTLSTEGHLALLRRMAKMGFGE